MNLDIDWTKVESSFKYAAMDSDGRVFLYGEVPCLRHSVWAPCTGCAFVEYPVGNLSASWGALDWKETLTERPTEKIEMNNTKAHPHADIITEAMKDTSRKIEGRHTEQGGWIELGLNAVVGSSRAWEFRFADTVKPTVIVTSPLTQRELQAVWEENGIPMSNGAVWDKLEQVGIAVKVATIKEVADISFNMPLPERNDGRFDPEHMIRFAAATVAEFRVQMLKLIGE